LERIEQKAVLQRGCLDSCHVGTVIMMMMENNDTFDYLDGVDGGGYFNEDPVGLLFNGIFEVGVTFVVTSVCRVKVMHNKY
jgi:hypothetical protein